MVERQPWIDPLVGNFTDMKPSWIGQRQLGVRCRATDDDIGEETELVLPAQSRQFGKGFVRRLGGRRVVKRRMDRLVTSGEKDVASFAGGEQRRGEDVVEAVVAATAKLIAPRRPRSSQQRMKVVNFRREHVAGFQPLLNASPWPATLPAWFQ